MTMPHSIGILFWSQNEFEHLNLEKFYFGENPPVN